MPSLDILTLRHEPMQAFFVSTSSSAISHWNSPRTAETTSLHPSQARVMADPPQSHDQRAIDLRVTFRRLLESTLNEQHQTTTIPSPISLLENLLANSAALPPGSASNPVLILDEAPSGSAIDPVVVQDDRSLQPSVEPQSRGNLPHDLRYQGPASGLENASEISSSHSTSSPRSHLFSIPDGISTTDTPPSFASSSLISGPSEPNSRTTPSQTWNLIVCSRCNQEGHTAKDHCEQCSATDHTISDHCQFCTIVGHHHSAHCIKCRHIGKCTGSCVNAHCRRCGEPGHHAKSQCERCGLAPHSSSDHCQVCDAVFCKADKHCNVCEDLDHTSKDHCELCRECGHTEDDHCIRCKQLGHQVSECSESDPVSVELCWTCRSFGHDRDQCRYRHQDELRIKWAYRLERRVMHAYDYCKCCREQGHPDHDKLVDCPKMTHRVGCLEKTHVNPKCIEWMHKSRKEGSYQDASTQANLAEYSTDVDLRNFDESQRKATVPAFHPPPNIFTVTSSSTQTAFVEVAAEIPDHVDEPARLLTEQLPIDQTATTLDEGDEEVHHNQSTWDPNYSWVARNRFISRLVGLPNELRDDYWNDAIEEEYGLTDPRRARQSSSHQQDTLEYALTQDRKRPVVQSSSSNRDARQRNPSPEPDTSIEVERTNIQRVTGYSSAGRVIMDDEISDDLEIIPDHTMIEIRKGVIPSCIVRKAPEPIESTTGCIASSSRTKSGIQNEHVPPQNVRKTPEISEQTSGNKRTIKTEPSSVRVDKRQKTNAVPKRSSIRTMTEIRNEIVPSHIVSKAPEPNDEVVRRSVGCIASQSKNVTETRNEQAPPRDVHEAPGSSSQTTSNKQTIKSESSEILVDGRQKTNSVPKRPHLATTSNAVQGRATEELDEGFWLDSNLHIQWKDICYMVIFEAPNHSTNLKQLHNLVTNWLCNTFPTHPFIHHRADMNYLKMIMQASPYIKSHKLNHTSKKNNPIEFSIRKAATTTIKTAVKAFTIKLATFKYQLCTLKYRPPNTKPRPRISFENLIGMALHQAQREYLSQEKLVYWIGVNIPGYDVEGWEKGMEEELHASSFFEQKDGKDEWSFREGCGEFFDKRDPKVVLAPVRSSFVRKPFIK
jgi:hypothetical protein